MIKISTKKLVALAFLVILHFSTSLHANEIYNMQYRLTQLGYEPGPTDGLMGTRTKNALKIFQRENGLRQSGELNNATRKALFPTGASGASAKRQQGDDSCIYANDNQCDEPSSCKVGTDSTDCSISNSAASSDVNGSRQSGEDGCYFGEGENCDTQPQQQQPQQQQPQQQQPQQQQPQQQLPQQQLPQQQQQPQFKMSCQINGESVYVDYNNRVYNQRGVFTASLMAPTHPQCQFNIVYSGGYYCVAHDGNVYHGTPYSVGGCRW